jgi:hypothetical protein
MRRILTEPEASLIKQYVALMADRRRDARFTDDAIDALADVAVAVNSSVENIGARRLQTVMERVLDEISFAAPDRHGETIKIDADYVQKHVGDLAKNADLSRFILYRQNDRRHRRARERRLAVLRRAVLRGSMAVPEAEFVHYLQSRMADPIAHQPAELFQYIWYQPLSKEIHDTWDACRRTCWAFRCLRC